MNEVMIVHLCTKSFRHAKYAYILTYSAGDGEKEAYASTYTQRKKHNKLSSGTRVGGYHPAARSNQSLLLEAGNNFLSPVNFKSSEFYSFHQ